MYLSVITTLIGIFLLFGGIAGFFPSLISYNGFLFNTFQINIIQNILFIVVGIIALISALKYKRDRLFLIVFGYIFVLLAIFCFVWAGPLAPIVNLADKILYLGIGVLFLILGYTSSKEGQV